MRKSKEARLSQIQSLLEEHESMAVKDLADTLAVTPETIRQDLNILERKDVIVREHGLARIVKNQVEIPFEVRKSIHFDLKQRIMFEAISQIEDGSTVFLDSGTTIYSGLDLLRSKKDITVVTNAIPIADACLDLGIQVLLVGGMMIQRGKRADGYFAMQLLDQIHIDLAIMASDGIRNLGGISVYSIEEFGTKRKVQERADRLIAVIDRSKFDRKGAFKAIDFKDFDLVITNTLNDEQRAQIENKTQILEVPDDQ
ncbi:DeoR/GlpR family DNA-binding transcription regulator [Erysipelotrichaceae bacterium 51-3]|uniref:DeoR/GlpR family DNA-binding transcription regulator n=1 Tax=Allobaculum sp. JKK-2023 TaxID=3108943 RepID=UPI002B05EB24|nr:DeoR/GlpR family DNA-binding transcription regulator [Allobaculum sp. JKK-2023]